MRLAVLRSGSLRAMSHRTALVFALLIGCGGAPPELSPAPAEPSEPPVATTIEGSIEAPSETPPEPAAVEPARLAVPLPADLAAAIAARLPTLELIPLSCGTSREPVALTDERVCLQDPTTGLTRAMRRFSTTSEHALGAARFGDDVVFGVQDPDVARTRYAGHLWRWSLRDDRYVGLAGLDDGGAYLGGVRVVALDVGLLVIAHTGDGDDRWWLFDGELRRLRALDERLGVIRVSGGVSYELSQGRQRGVLATLRIDGPRVVRERVADYPRVEGRPLALFFPEGRPLIVSAFPRARSTSVYVIEPPATEVRELSVALVRPSEMRFEGGRVLLRDRAGWHAVDLGTGTHEDAAAPEAPPEVPTPTPRSIHAVTPEADAVVLFRWGPSHRLSSAGVADLDLDEAPRAAPSGCRCDEAALRCGEEVIAGACADVAELERVRDLEAGTTAAPTLYSPTGAIRYRVDRLEPDLTRVTRLSDGARLWLRTFDAGVLAQADDGAFVAPEGLSLAGFSLRWGRSLLDAPVTELVPYVEQLRRPTLIEDFFAGRPLPSADTTLPAPDAADAGRDRG